MFAATGGGFTLVFFAGVATLFLHRASDVADALANGPATRLLGFFGIGGLPVLLAAGLFLAVAGASGIAHAGLARASLGHSGPPWLPVLAALSAAASGLAVLRLATLASLRQGEKKLGSLQKIT